MNKKGFTLIELLAVIVILSLLALLSSNAITNMVKDSKEELYNTQIKLIESAAQSWAADHLDLLPEAGTCKFVKLYYLQSYGVISNDITNPKTNKPYGLDFPVITIEEKMQLSLISDDNLLIKLWSWKIMLSRSFAFPL